EEASMLHRSKKSNGLNSRSPLEKSELPQPTSKKSLLPEESRGATGVSASARAKSDLDFIIDQLSQSSPPESRTPPTSSQNAIEEAAQKLLSEDEKAALACVEGDFAA